MLLNFQTLPCPCGGSRILGSSCPECGRKPLSGEVNRYVVHRRSGLARVLALLGPDTNPTETNPHESPQLAAPPAARIVNELLETLLAAIADFSAAPTSEHTVDALARAVTKLRTARQDALVAARLRPTTGTWTAVGESIDRIERVWDLYRDVLTADTVLDAQKSGKDAQDGLDTVRTPLQQIDEWENFAAILGDESRPIPERMFASLRTRFPNVTISELPSHGVAMTGRDLAISIGTNSGMSYLLLQPIAHTMLNPDVFRSKILQASSGLTNATRLREVALMDGAVQALADTHRLMVEAVIAFTAILAVESDERAVARRFGKLASEIYEASTAVLAWYRLMTTDRAGADAFTKVSAEDATKLAADLQKGALAPVFDDAARYLRHAPVHGRALDYEPNAGAFVINLKSHSETVLRDVFIDRVYAFLETVFASTWALSNAIDVAGIDVTLSDSDALYMGFTPLVLTAIALPVTADLTVRDYQEVDGGWTFYVDGDVDLLTPALVAAENAVGHVPEIQLLGPAGDPLLTVSLADSWAWRNTDGYNLQMNFLGFKASAEREGHSLLSHSDVQFMLSVLGIALLGGDAHAIVHLRRLKTWALERKWAEDAALADQIIATLRRPTPPGLTTRLAEIAQNSKRPQMPTSRAVRVLVPPTR
ncbi:hypothetical protein BMW26_03260 [Microbacterium sp. 1.5R]|uniref:hypothetical protein n=1 Tax=Microbacterium sp. 1.5R TaxID=1916917 RepID=UPI00090A70C0|nr:hypothetical protein [Microbacterium sp. 1.5R]APH44089.1 hypothetical protein BMW26_03260 [Microbacterium sp. 1.5R]